jgi:GTP-binding protein HflX
MWTHLERQQGGIGLRGPGETELETDRRVIRTKISRLKEQLAGIDKQMITQRKKRGELVRVALVGYTNVGKSTLMNLMSKSDVFAENKLFATLDTTVRKVTIGNLPFLLSDTVGFIRKLPTSLVESFKSTLDEIREADILLHVVDISHPNFAEQIHIVEETLTEIGAGNKETIMVFNKIDAVKASDFEPAAWIDNQPNPERINSLNETWVSNSRNSGIIISAFRKYQIRDLHDLLYQKAKAIHITRYPYDNLLY